MDWGTWAWVLLLLLLLLPTSTQKLSRFPWPSPAGGTWGGDITAIVHLRPLAQCPLWRHVFDRCGDAEKRRVGEVGERRGRAGGRVAAYIVQELRKRKRKRMGSGAVRWESVSCRLWLRFGRQDGRAGRIWATCVRTGEEEMNWGEIRGMTGQPRSRPDWPWTGQGRARRRRRRQRELNLNTQ